MGRFFKLEGALREDQKREKQVRPFLNNPA
jgi:hypothetical protein